MTDQTEEIKNKLLEDLNEEKTLLEWDGPERSFQKKDRDFWVTIFAIFVLVVVILVFVKEFFLIMALISILFLYYVLSTVPPKDIKYKITNRGVYFDEGRYEWSLLTRFWFKKSLSTEMIHFETVLRFPRQISMVINETNKEKIKEIVLKRIPMIEESPNFVDKMTKWIIKKLPLEKREDEKKA